VIAGRLRNFFRGLIALITLTAMTAGLPIALYEFGGSPIPARVPSLHRIVFVLLHKDNGSLFFGAVKEVSWLAWLAFAVAVIAEAQAAARGRRAPRLHLSVLQSMAGRLVALAALTFTTPAAVTLATSSAMASTVQSVAPGARPDLVTHTATAAEAVASERAVVVVVRPGDCLWTIAEHYLGNGDRYTEIVRLNIGHEMDGGRVFTDPSIILPGWHLALPAVAATGSSQHGSQSAGSRHSVGGAHGSTHHDGHSSAHSRFSEPHHSAGHFAGPGHAGAGGTHRANGSQGAAGAQSATGAAGGGGGTQAAGSNASGASAVREHDQVAEVALFALGMLGGAALASIDRLRHRQRQFRRPGRRIALPSDPASRRIEQKLRAAAARWPASRADDEPDEWADSRPPPQRPAWPERPSLDQRGPAGNKLPPVGYKPPGDSELTGDFELAGDFDPEDDLEPDDGYGWRRGYEAADDYYGDEAQGQHGSYGSADGQDDTEQFDEPAGQRLGAAPEGSRVGTPGSGDRARAHGIPASLRDALRDLSEGIAVGGEPLPPIVGIHLTADTLDVLLSAPAATPPPAPFVIAPARQAMCWTVKLGDARAVAAQPPIPGEVGDLLPGLFTAGATGAGGYLLLDLEAMRVTCCDGPDDLIDRLLVTAATELASSHWSGWYELVLAGCDELDVLGRADLCRDLDEAIDLLDARAQTIARRMSDDGPPDVRTRRLADPDDEDWGLTLLVSRLRPTPSQMARLLEFADGPGGIAVLVAGDTQTQDGKLAPALFELAADADRPDEIVATITLAYLGPHHQIKVWPQTLTVPEYEALAGVFATAADTTDVSVDEDPYNDFGAPPWIRLAAAPVAPAEAEADAGLDGPDGAFGYPAPEMMESVGWDARLRPEDRPVSEPRLGPRPRHAAPSLQVKVLGPVEITGTAEQLLPKQAELLLALALHAPVGVSNSGLCSLLGPDADHPRPADSVRQLITRTRKRLGQARDGQEYIIHLGSGIYVPHGDLSLDWAVFSGLARRGRAERRREDLRAAMALVRGEPFADCYHWWIDVGLIETIRAEIIDTAELLAQLDLAAGDPRGAAQAAKAGLSAETAAEQLWRILMRAEYESGNPDGVTAAWTGCLDAIAEIAPGGEPHPDTEQLFHQLTKGAPIASR
jgi:DNA-binding SARP family transcriptional activator